MHRLSRLWSQFNVLAWLFLTTFAVAFFSCQKNKTTGNTDSFVNVMSSLGGGKNSKISFDMITKWWILKT
jgi:hypothetical protein